jgi:hypothetical protein
MTHNTLVRADLTAWSNPTAAVTAAEYRALDLGQFQSINGDQGGVWAPVTKIQVGGQGVLITGKFDVTGSTDFDNHVDFNDNVTFNEFVSFAGTVSITGFLDVAPPDGWAFAGAGIFYEGVAFQGEVDFLGNVVTHADLQIGTSGSDGLDVRATSTFNGEATFEAVVHLGAFLACNEDVRLGSDSGDDLEVRATSTFLGETTFEDDVHVGAPLHINDGCTIGSDSGDACTIKATTTLQTALQFSGDGRIPLREHTLGLANFTRAVADGDTFYFPAADPGQQFNIDDTGAANGDHMLVINCSTANYIGVAPPVGTVIAIKASNATTPGWVHFVRIGGTWVPVGKFTV